MSLDIYRGLVRTLIRFSVVNDSIRSWGYQDPEIYHRRVLNFVTKYGIYHE